MNINRRTLDRRGFLALTGTAAAGALLVSACGSDDGPGGGDDGLSMQLNWIGDYGVLGECVALEKGYYSELGLNLRMQPGGPNIDPVSVLGAGGAESGQASSPAAMLARSRGVPIRSFAAVSQRHPYAYFSLPRRPILEPKDMIGATIGVPATGVVMLEALLAANDIDSGEVKTETVGSDWAVLASGRVDAMTGYLTSVQGRDVLGDTVHSLSLEDGGVNLYAYLYLCTDEVLESRSEALEALVVGSSKGWDFARENPEEAVALLKKRFPNIDDAAQLESANRISEYIWTDDTVEHGFGYQSERTWQAQIDMWDELGQFQAEPPKATDVATDAILDATSAERVKA
ncbi:ABC transporter substrate-binding protein [Actinophytocola xinjiangensis]|uniref:ABC transporter substrate-binding protein n=1 Tax=Actinophytocola xinjiangensis TaxID=485602 RepID=UPI000A538D06|nr:ABC transporter substrate-binding protein [Actinophytocola xinjiangensis]